MAISIYKSAKNFYLKLVSRAQRCRMVVTVLLVITSVRVQIPRYRSNIISAHSQHFIRIPKVPDVIVCLSFKQYSQSSSHTQTFVNIIVYNIFNVFRINSIRYELCKFVMYTSVYLKNLKTNTKLLPKIYIYLY